MNELSDWIGRREERRETLGPWPAQALHAALDRAGEPPAEGDALPPFWTALYFHAATRRADLGRDGHLERGRGLTPPIRAARRLWGGLRLEATRPLLLGQPATRVDTLAALRRVEGRAGPMTVATIRREAHGPKGPAETLEEDILYLDAAPEAAETPSDAETALDAAPWSRVWTVDPPLLFRYSALTWNAHRIHYDRDFCRALEGASALIVHGPLIATLMLELARERGPDRPVRRFEARARARLLEAEPFEVRGWPNADRSGARLEVRSLGAGARLVMSGAILYADAESKESRR